MIPDKQQIFDKIRAWEMDAGESFIDHWGSNITIPNFMFWCLGKGYLHRLQFMAWEHDYVNDRMSDAHEPNSFLGGDSESPYALCTLDEWEKGIEILSEFISQSGVYQERLDEFLNSEEY